MAKDSWKTWVIVLLIVGSIYAIYWSYNQSCDLTLKVNNMPLGYTPPSITYPEPLQKLSCMVAVKEVAIISVLAFATLSFATIELWKKVLGK